MGKHKHKETRVLERYSVLRTAMARWTLIVLLQSHLLWVYLCAQENEREVTQRPKEVVETRPVNVLFINDQENDMANKSVTEALNAMNERFPNHIGRITQVQVNSSDSRDTAKRICFDFQRFRRDAYPDIVLDTTKNGQGAEMVQLITAVLGIPTLSTQFGQVDDLKNWRDLSEDQRNYLIQISHPADLIPEVMPKLAILMNISNAAVLFDENFMMDHKYKSLFLNVPTRHVILKAKSTIASLQRQLSELRELDIVNFFVLGDTESITRCLLAAEQRNFTGHKYAWYTLSLNEGEQRCGACNNITILSFSPEDSKPSRDKAPGGFSNKDTSRSSLVSAFYHDLTHLGISAMKNSLDAGDWPMNPRHITCESYARTGSKDRASKTPTRKFDFLAKLKEATNSSELILQGFTWGGFNGQNWPKFNMILKLINIVAGNIASEESVGNWNAGLDSPLKMENVEKVMKHTALTNYRVVTKLHPPFVMFNESSQSYEGYCIDLLNEIQKELLFTYEIYQVEDDNYGNLDKNGNWNGMIGDLKDKRADIALGSLAVMAERESVIDYTVPFYDLVGLSIMIQKPQSPTSLFKFLTVLENEVWFSILAAYAFTSILLWGFDRWSPYSYQNNREKYKDDDEKRVFTVKESMFFCMTSLTPQGGGEAPKNLSGRVLAATWWLFGFIVIASYTANLAAFLTVSRLDTPIESLDDLSQQYKIQYATLKGSSAYDYFSRMAAIENKFYEIWKEMSLNESLSIYEKSQLAVWDYPVSDKFTKMFQSMKDAGFPSDMQEGVDRVRNSSGQFALIEDAAVIKYWVKNSCDLQTVGKEFSKKPYAIAVQQSSPLKDQLNSAILVLLNQRTLEKLKQKWWDIKVDCEKEDDQSGGIGIRNIGGVFIVIFVGIGLACVTLIFEYYYYRNQLKVQEVQSRRDTNLAQNIPTMKLSLRPAPTQLLQRSTLFRSRF